MSRVNEWYRHGELMKTSCQPKYRATLSVSQPGFDTNQRVFLTVCRSRQNPDEFAAHRRP